jgi:cystathionine beta-lyase
MSMETYDFNERIDRRGTGALKTDALLERYGREDVIPMWVADMDFRSCPAVGDAIRKRCEEGIFGYTLPQESYYRSIVRWVGERHGWEIEREWLSYIPGIVKGIALTVMHLTAPGDRVIIQPPVYHPFRLVPEMHGRQVVVNPLMEEGGRYRMDLEGLRRMKAGECRLLLLANPHNPIGITWSEETLRELADVCYERQIVVVSDEIHADMALFGHRHVPFATVSERAAENSITFMAPSKTFNMAGIVSSYAIVPNEEIRRSFYGFLQASELNEGTIFAYVATQAAYTHGAEWRRQMIAYVEENIRFVDRYLAEHVPGIRAVVPEASFLVWLDCRALGLSQQELTDRFVNGARLALNSGAMFGAEGEGFMRMNVGCPRVVVAEALERIKRCFGGDGGVGEGMKVS